MKAPLQILFTSVCLALWIGFLNSFNVMAQNPPLAGCPSGHAAPVNYRGWPQGQSVDVYIDPAITGLRRSSVETAFNNWSQNAGSNGSGVTYNFVSQPLPAGTGLTVLNQQPTSGDRAYTVTVTNDNTGDTCTQRRNSVPI